MEESENEFDIGQELININFNGINIEQLDKITILDDKVFEKIFAIKNNLEKTKLIVKLQEKAKELKVGRSFDKLLKSYQQDFIQSNKQKGSNIIKVTNSPIENLKSGTWNVDDFGVYKNKMINFESTKVTACPHPILPIERLKNIDTDIEKVKLAFYKDKSWQNVTVEKKVIASNTTIIQLSNRGIDVTSNNAKELVGYLSEILELNDIPLSKGINRLGWTDLGFSPYVDELKYDGDIENKNIFDSIKEKGKYEVWKKHCIELRKKSKIAQLMLSTSFASPLIKILGINCYCLHLWGGTGAGKTVALMLAMSIWGNPSVGKLVTSTNCTKVFLERVSAFHHDIPVALDELQIIKNKFINFDELIMMLTEGVNRGRGKATGGTEEKLEWNCNFLFTGEQPITQQNSGGGAKNRVIEVKAVEKIIQDGMYTSNILKENYGFAGKIFIENLPSKEELIKEHKKITEEILKCYDTTEKQAIPLASILVADKISTDLIFKDSSYLSVNDLIKYLNTSKEIDIAERAYEWLNDWIFQNENKFKIDVNTETYGILEEDKNVCWILRKVFDEVLENNDFSSRAILEKFAEKEYIEKDLQGKFTCVKKCNGKSKRFIKLYLKIDEENEISDGEVLF